MGQVGPKTRWRPEPKVSVPQTAADVLRDHVTLECEAIDRLYLNVYVPHLQTAGAVVGYLRGSKGQRFALTGAVAPMSGAVLKSVEALVACTGVDVLQFKKGERNDEVTQGYLAHFQGTEGVLYVRKAQENARVMRTERRRNPRARGVRTCADPDARQWLCDDLDGARGSIACCASG
jgi:hypothetical protein